MSTKKITLLRKMIMKKSFLNAEKIFREHHGILRTGQAKKLGIDEPILIQMHEDGLLVREARGLYRLAELPPLSNPDFVQVSIRIPESVICLISALNFHHLTTQIPFRIYIALPQNIKPPRIEYPPLDIIYLSDKPYVAGIETYKIDGIPVKIYSREKSVADCFKFKNKIGSDIALEALKDYLNQPNRNIAELMNCARINRVEKIMRPYLQAAL
jgi:predicted transcriptional regulator of viral defense system